MSANLAANPRKKSSPSKSAPATSQSTQQLPLPPLQLLPSTPESQSHSSQQQQQAQPNRPNHPWSVLRPASHNNDVPSSTSPSPFLRFGHTLSITGAGELLFFGGFAHGSLRNDLYVFSMRDRSISFLKTSGVVPSPRGILASVLVSNVLLIFGGITNMDVDNRGFLIGPYDDSLYLLSLGTLNPLMLRPNLADSSFLLVSIARVDPRRGQWSQARRSYRPCCDDGRFQALRLRWSDRRWGLE